MFGWFKKLFAGRPRGQSEMTPEREAFDEEKQKALEAALGPMEEYVVHSLIPMLLGGGVDLYPFRRHMPGTVYVTQELFAFDEESRPKKSKQGWYELAAAFREEAEPAGKVPKSLEEADAAMGEDGELTGGARPADSAQETKALLTPLAHYAGMASLSPGETAEIPGDEGEPNTCVVFDRLECAPMAAGGTPFFLLLVIRIHPEELALARREGSGVLLERLKERGYYPYSDLDRAAVVSS